MEGRVGRASSNGFSIHPPNIPGARSYQCVAGGSVATRGARRHRVLFKLLRFATRRVAVLGAFFLDQDDSNGYFDPEAGLSGHVHASA